MYNYQGQRLATYVTKAASIQLPTPKPNQYTFYFPTAIMTRRHHHTAKVTARPGERATASSDKYGVWKGTPISYSDQTLEQDKSPHLTINFTSGTSSKTYEAQVNVASTEKETELVYWMDKAWTHPLTSTLSALSEDFHQATTTDGTGLSLDFIRTTPTLVDLASGLIVQDDDSSDTANNILSQLAPIVEAAITAKSSMYIFGRNYSSGIDDVHMNQGNTGSYENAVGTDGALIFENSDGTFEAVFLAFATQEVPTDDTTGKPEVGAKALNTIAKGTSTS